MNTNFLILGVAVILAVLVATMAYTGGFFWLTPVSSATTQISIPTPTPFCTDPDGRNYFYKGTCSDVLGNYTDYCYGNITCNEYYCPTNMSNCTKEPIDCRMVSGSNGVCSNGACQRQQQQNQTNCTDSDGGANLGVFGVCRGSNGAYSDSCTSGGLLKENYCVQNSYCANTEYNCLAYGYHGCVNGVCVRNQTNQTNNTSCFDSDGGIRPYVFGIVNPGNHYDFCWYNGTNVTNSTNVLAEFYCEDDYPSRVLIYCPGGCSNGTCLNETRIGVNAFIDNSPGYQLDDIDPNKRSCQGGGWYRHTYATDQDCFDGCYDAAFSYCSSLSPDCWPKWQSCNGRFCKSACQYFGGDYKNFRI